MRSIGTALTLLALFTGIDAQDSYLRDADQDLRLAMGKRDKKAVETAIRSVSGSNDSAAVGALLRHAAAPTIKTGDWNEYYWMLLGGVASMTSRDSMMSAAEFVLTRKRRPIARDLLFVLTNRGHPTMIPAMCLLLEKGPEDIQIIAADHLAAIGDESAIKPLNALLTTKSATLRDKVERALQAIQGLKRVKSETETVLDRLDRSRWTDHELLKEAKFLVIRAGDRHCGRSHDHDHLDRLLRRMKLKYDVVDKADLETGKHPKLADYPAVLANCTDTSRHCDLLKCVYCKPSKNKCACPKNVHPATAYVLGPKGRKKLAVYVKNGGHLFTQDKGLEDIIEKTFPRRIARGDARPKEEVRLLPMPGSASHEYIRKVYYRSPQKSNGRPILPDFRRIGYRWTLDEGTHRVRILNPRKVQVLLTSELGDDPLAVTLENGRVLYIVTHFAKQSSDGNRYTVENLLVNFLIRAVRPS